MASAVKLWLSLCQSRKLGYEMEPVSKLGLAASTATSSPGCGKAMGCSSTVFTMENSAVLTPMPSAKVMTTTAGKSRRFAQLAQCEAEVLQQVLKPGQRVALAHRLLRLLHATHLDQRLATSLFSGHPGAELVLDVHLQVALQLGSDFVVRAPRAEQTTKADPQRSEGAHHASSAGERKRATMALACSQLRASRSSCLRPARVSR